MAFNVQYSFNNGAVTGRATNILQLHDAIYNYAHSGNVNNSTGNDYHYLTQCTLSGTAEGDLTTDIVGGIPIGGVHGLFEKCSSLTNVDLSNLDTSNVTNMRYMFYSCKALASLDLSNLNTSNVTDMMQMFARCTELTSIYVGEGWNTDKVTVSDNMFDGCTKLPNFDSTKTDKTYAYIGGYLEKAPATTPSIKKGILARAWKKAYTPVTPSLEIGVSKMTKNILGTDFNFTYVGDKDGQAVFMCDTNVETYNFNADYQKTDANKYEGSDLEARVATYGSEYFIPTAIDIANWTNTDISTLDSDGYAYLNSNSPIYDFVRAKNYWTSSAYLGRADNAYMVYRDGYINSYNVSFRLGVRPCFAIAK